MDAKESFVVTASGQLSEQGLTITAAHQLGVDHRDRRKQLEIGTREFALPFAIGEYRCD